MTDGVCDDQNVFLMARRSLLLRKGLPTRRNFFIYARPLDEAIPELDIIRNIPTMT